MSGDQHPDDARGRRMRGEIDQQPEVLADLPSIRAQIAEVAGRVRERAALRAAGRPGSSDTAAPYVDPLTSRTNVEARLTEGAG